MDARLLGLPAVRSFRNRFLAARDELARALYERSGEPLDVLSVPCGIPRELATAAEMARQHGADLGRVVFHGLDLDCEVLRQAEIFAREQGLANFRAHQGDALTRNSYPQAADFVTSTGLAEFLPDKKLLELYRRGHEVLRSGGVFVSSGMQRRRVSEYLLKMAEIRVHYRDAERLEAIAQQAGLRQVRVRYDAAGIQCILVARK